MRDYLIVSLVAPMGAFGDLAGHEWRGTWRWPGRAAILGLIGGALGVRREDQAGQDALSVWNMAVSVLSDGPVWCDFHTVQTVPSARIKRPRTRRDAIQALKPDDYGLVTRREYMSDCAFGVALWGGKTTPLVEALKRPAFTPYLGRKSCPLSAPIAPCVVQSENAVEALSHVTLPYFLSEKVDPAKPVMIVSEEDNSAGRIETRWDVPLDRQAWHFGPRDVYLHRPENTT